MILQRIKRKLYKALHPVVGEIWMLHRVMEQRSQRSEQRELEVTPQYLEQTIKEYQQKGYTFVPIDALPKNGRWICVTFDDGYHDNYTLAYPLLKQLGIPFTVYVSTGFIDNKQEMWWYRCESREQCQTCLSNAEVQQRERSYPGERLGLSTDELKALDADPLCTIGAHTVSHPKLDTLSYEEQYKEIADC
ncbi:MAG: polysaccharide deacetylase family protein, partial [Bacteroidaceae bacterium]|nr:polysaccharide deacetylase family protein [Bacteroidaceae bacterium]